MPSNNNNNNNNNNNTHHHNKPTFLLHTFLIQEIQMYYYYYYCTYFLGRTYKFSTYSIYVENVGYTLCIFAVIVSVDLKQPEYIA